MPKTSSSYASRVILLGNIAVFLQSAPVHAQAPGIYINEIQVSTTRTDWEFVELHGAPGTDLSDLTLVGVESDNGTSAGTIDVAISLAGESIPADGFWLAIAWPDRPRTASRVNWRSATTVSKTARQPTSW